MAVRIVSRIQGHHGRGLPNVLLMLMLFDLKPLPEFSTVTSGSNIGCFASSTLRTASAPVIHAGWAGSIKPTPDTVGCWQMCGPTH